MKSNSKIEEIVPSVITASMNLEGDMYGEGALEIEGNMRGNIRCLSLLVGPNANVQGDITAEKVEIYGNVVGNVTAKKIICGATAKVTGDILHSSIHVENGAYIDGSCRKFVVESEATKVTQLSESSTAAELVYRPSTEEAKEA